MYNSTRIIITVCVVLLACTNLLAQPTKDFTTQTSIGVAWQPTKKLQVTPGYRLSLVDNSTRFGNSMFSLAASYDVLKWWKVGGEYRYYTSYKKDRQRFIVFTRFNYKVGKYNILYRLQYQQQQEYFDSEYLKAHEPSKVYRNRLQLRYSYNKRLELFTYVESFTRRSKGEFTFYRMRYAVGGEYLYKRRHSFNVQTYYNDEFNRSDPSDRLTLALGYTYHLEKKKKKKKEKQKEEKS
jgi:hypothetical protein